MRRDVSFYIANHWNHIDFLGLGLVAGGLVVRFAEGSKAWGRALYALSAPLLFSRVLFFAQMLRFQGPMIQASPAVTNHTMRSTSYLWMELTWPGEQHYIYTN